MNNVDFLNIYSLIVSMLDSKKYRLHKERYKFRPGSAITQKAWIITRKGIRAPSACRPGRETAPNVSDKGEWRRPQRKHTGEKPAWGTTDPKIRGAIGGATEILLSLQRQIGEASRHTGNGKWPERALTY